MSFEKPVLHQYQVSPFAAKVRRVMYYKKIGFDVVNYGLTDAGKIKKLNPRSKAPFLEHNGEIIADSTDIIIYLEKNYPDNPVIPSDPIIKAQAHILEDWADESLYFYDITMRSWPNNAQSLADDLLLEDKGLMAKIFRAIIPKAIAKQASAQGVGRKEHAAVCDEVAEHFNAINALLASNNYLLAEQLTVADISVASMCTVLERAEEARALMGKFPQLMAWRERIDSMTLPENTPENQRALV